MDRQAIFIFHGELRPLLTPGAHAPRPGRDGVRLARASGRVAYPVDREASIKDAIESLGVPHTEVGGIEVGLLADANESAGPSAANGGADSRRGETGYEALQTVGFDWRLAAGTTVHVRPHEPPVDVAAPTLLRPAPLDAVRFVADACVGRLAGLLRTLGLDTAYGRDWTDDVVAALGRDEQRIVLTRDRALLKRSAVVHGRLVRADKPEAQLVEVLGHFGLTGPFTPFTRCVRCNDELVPVPKAEVLHLLEPLTKKHFNEFHQCRACGRVYWPGSHHEAMLRRLERLGLA